MKSPALKHLLIALVVMLAAGELLPSQSQSTQCKCADPPGGVVTCERGQVPICIVKDGKVTSECKSLPSDRKTAGQQSAWLLSIVIGKEVTEAELAKNPQYQRILLEARLSTGQLSISFVSLVPSIADLSIIPAIDALFFGGRQAGPGIITAMRTRYLGPPKLVRPESGDPFEQSLYKGDEWYDSGNYAKAMEEYRAAVRLAPKVYAKARAYEGIGLSLQSMERYDDAISAFQEAIKASPQDADLYAAMGTILFMSQKYAEAEEAFKRAVRLKPDAAAFASMGSSLFAQKKFAEAETAFVNATRLQPNDATSLTALALARFFQGKYEQAAEAFKAAIALRAADAELYFNAGLVQYLMGNYSAAENFLKSAIRVYPSSAKFYAELGRVLYTQLRYPEAEEAFAKAISIEPTTANFYAGLGDSYAAQQMLDKAKVQYGRALALEPNNPVFKKRLADFVKAK